MVPEYSMRTSTPLSSEAGGPFLASRPLPVAIVDSLAGSPKGDRAVPWDWKSLRFRTIPTAKRVENPHSYLTGMMT